MRVGGVFSQTELGGNPEAVHKCTQASESLGYNRILAYDYVLGAGTSHYQRWNGAYRLKDEFCAPFIFFGCLAALTSSIDLTANIMILPQRQTILFAKQTAAVDIL